MNVAQKGGFTLIEVMLAMTLLSIMVVLLFSSLKIGAESWDKGETKIGEVNQKAVVYHFFKRHLLSVKPLWDDFSENDRVFSFQGEENHFQFVSSFPASAARKGLQLFSVQSDVYNEGRVSVGIRPFYPPAEDEEWKDEEVVLVENVEDFRIQYLTKEDGDSAGYWVGKWLEKETLPALIKIKITLLDESYWPEMIFPLKLAESAEPSVEEFVP